MLHNLCTDVWAYISMGYFRQIPQEGATGSSTMPHKINPIRFENAESNLELSSALLDSLAQTLVTSRLQRDLTDSSTQRNIGVALGHSVLALDNIERGLREIDLDRERVLADLDGNWEVLGEAIQTVIRAEVTAGRSSIADPYAVLKDLTRGTPRRRTGARRVHRGPRHRRRGEAAAAARSRPRPTSGLADRARRLPAAALVRVAVLSRRRRTAVVRRAHRERDHREHHELTR